MKNTISLSNSSRKLSPNAARSSVYDQITDRIIAMLESGTVPWRKPWKSESIFPRNLVSKKAYRGINVFLLHAMGYESPFWLTFRQALELGGNVRKGEKACPVVFWKRIDIEGRELGEKQKIPMLRYYHVFNLAQCDGIKIFPAPAIDTPSISLPAKPEEILLHMPERPEIQHGMRKAYYSLSADIVGMPDKSQFETGAAYYATLFHELVHSTGHRTRLNRPTVTENAGFGSDPYSKEELIAEMGAAFLCGQAGIESTLENSAAYLAGWLEQLRNDKTLIIQAAAQAQKAADFILGVKFEESTTAPDQSIAA